MPDDGGVVVKTFASSAEYDPHDRHDRLWWQTESRRLNSDWASGVALHHDVVRSLRRAYEAAAKSSIASSSNIIALKDFYYG